MEIESSDSNIQNSKNENSQNGNHINGHSEHSNKSKGMEQFRNTFFEHRFIPPQKLGQVLEIYSYYQYFDDLLEGPEFELEELWACFCYNGDDFLELVHDLHTVIIYIFMESIKENLQKYENYQSNSLYSYFSIIYQMGLEKKFRKQLLGLIWPELLTEILQIFNTKVQDKDSIILLLKNLDVQNYNSIPLDHKISILQALINASEDLNEIRAHHNSKSESAQELVKEKGKAQRKLYSIQQEIQQFKREQQIIENEMKENEQKKESLLNMDKKESHQLLSNINSLRSKLNSKNRSLDLLNNKQSKLQKQIAELKQQQPYVVQPARTLHVDNEGNILWTFFFHPDLIYYQDKNDNWCIYTGEIKELINTLDENDQEQQLIAQTIKHQFDLGIIENAKPEILKDLNYYLEMIFDYETFLKPKISKRKSRKDMKSEFDQKYTEIYDLIEQLYIPERQNNDMFRNFIFFMEKEINNYLEYKDAFWLEAVEREKFEKEVNELSQVSDFTSFLKNFEKNLSQVYIYQEEQEEIDEQEQSNEQENEKIENKMEIEENEEEEEIMFKRRNNIKGLLPNQQSGLKKKKINLKFWNFYFQNVKKMWREIISITESRGGVYFCYFIFTLMIAKFSINKISKIKEQNEKLKEMQEKEELNSRLRKKNQKLNNEEFYSRYMLRKNRLLKQNKDSQTCQECGGFVNKTNSIHCFSCEGNHHLKCVDLETNEIPEWRCNQCIELINNSRMTRNMRKKLKYYEQQILIFNNYFNGKSLKK